MLYFFCGGCVASYGALWPLPTHWPCALQHVFPRWLLGLLWLPPDWTWGSHFSVTAWIPVAWISMARIPMVSPRLDLGIAPVGDSVTAWIPMAWICMACILMDSLRLDLGGALFGDRLDPCGLDSCGFPPTGPGGRTCRWPLGSLWLGSLWLLPPDWIWGSHFSVAARIRMAWIPMVVPRLDLGGALVGDRLDPCG